MLAAEDELDVRDGTSRDAKGHPIGTRRAGPGCEERIGGATHGTGCSQPLPVQQAMPTVAHQIALQTDTRPARAIPQLSCSFDSCRGHLLMSQVSTAASFCQALRLSRTTNAPSSRTITRRR
jgi:hypothetical protein